MIAIALALALLAGIAMLVLRHGRCSLQDVSEVCANDFTRARLPQQSPLATKAPPGPAWSTGRES